jgi:hypothetical protein
MNWDNFWQGVTAAGITIGILIVLIFLIQVDRVRLYNYEGMQQTCVVKNREILRCYASEQE